VGPPLEVIVITRIVTFVNRPDRLRRRVGNVVGLGGRVRRRRRCRLLRGGQHGSGDRGEQQRESDGSRERHARRIPRSLQNGGLALPDEDDAAPMAGELGARLV
jgi:hypothetical protein